MTSERCSETASRTIPLLRWLGSHGRSWWAYLVDDCLPRRCTDLAPIMDNLRLNPSLPYSFSFPPNPAILSSRVSNSCDQLPARRHNRLWNMTFLACWVTIPAYPIGGGYHANKSASCVLLRPLRSRGHIPHPSGDVVPQRDDSPPPLYLTGLRRQELCNLSVEDVVLERSRLLIRTGKGEKSRVVPIAESLVADLWAYIGRRTSGPLFLS